MDEPTDSMVETLEGVRDTVHIFLGAKHGTLDDGETTLNLRGETEAEALGHAYHLRDELRDSGYEAEAEYVELADEQPDWSSQPRHLIRLRWSRE